jgi:hypothetical protein
MTSVVGDQADHEIRPAMDELSQDFENELLNKIESPVSSFASQDYIEADMKCEQSDVTNRTKQSWSTMSLPQAEPGLLRGTSA